MQSSRLELNQTQEILICSVGREFVSGFSYSLQRSLEPRNRVAILFVECPGAYQCFVYPHGGYTYHCDTGVGWSGLARAGAGYRGLPRVTSGWRGLARAGAGWRGLARAGAGWRGLTRADAG